MIQSIFSDRNQRAVPHSRFLNWSHIKVGVLQGLILGLWLSLGYIIYVSLYDLLEGLTTNAKPLQMISHFFQLFMILQHF